MASMMHDGADAAADATMTTTDDDGDRGVKRKSSGDGGILEGPIVVTKENKNQVFPRHNCPKQFEKCTRCNVSVDVSGGTIEVDKAFPWCLKLNCGKCIDVQWAFCLECSGQRKVFNVARIAKGHLSRHAQEFKHRSDMMVCLPVANHATNESEMRMDERDNDALDINIEAFDGDDFHDACENEDEMITEENWQRLVAKQ